MIKKIVFLVYIAFTLNANAQTSAKFSTVKTLAGDVKIPGNWKLMNTIKDSTQTDLINSEGVIITIGHIPKNTYSFYKSSQSDFENVKSFYAWECDIMKEEKYTWEKIKENSQLGYIIFKYNSGKPDNVFLFGSVKDNFLNLLVYSNIWDENKKILFLENLYQLNK